MYRLRQNRVQFDQHMLDTIVSPFTKWDLNISQNAMIFSLKAIKNIIPTMINLMNIRKLVEIVCQLFKEEESIYQVLMDVHISCFKSPHAPNYQRPELTPLLW